MIAIMMLVRCMSIFYRVGGRRQGTVLQAVCKDCKNAGADGSGEIPGIVDKGASPFGGGGKGPTMSPIPEGTGTRPVATGGGGWMS